MHYDLKGKRAVVTGSAQGIGFTIAAALCRCGVHTCLMDNNEARLSDSVKQLKSMYPDGLVFGEVCDVSNVQSVDKAFKSIEKNFGMLDVLVNNAGIMKRSMLAQIPLDEWNRLIGVNLTGTLHCVQAALPFMKSSKQGVIINVSSNVATVPSVGMGAYAISKAAVEVMTRVLAAELAPFGIRVNAYAPGVVETEMTSDILQERAEEKLRTIPLRRFSKPQEIAQLVLFLASEESAYINGSVIPIDGGMLATHNPWKAW